MTIEFHAIEFDNADEAIQHTYADPRDGVAVLLGGKHYVMQKTEAERLAADGVEFATCSTTTCRTAATSF